MQIEVADVVRLFASGLGVGIVLSFVPWLCGIVVGFAINIMKK
ncbi:MAG: hypothetical protein E6124_16395 [Blautia producta]|nr:hypothetical protein [Blautia producta]MDU5221941.1 hypothetical protein [Blautia producta]MDU5383752.1 hypothetical protein [Blautia producta]MDU6884783.1 hypothetical protein [Blautia producta]